MNKNQKTKDDAPFSYDIYSAIAKRTGVDRHLVKTIALQFMYGSRPKGETQKQLEDEILRAVVTIHGVKKIPQVMKIHFVDGMPLRAYEPKHVNDIQHLPGHEYVDYVAAEKVNTLLDRIATKLNKNDKGPNNVAVRAAIKEFKQK